MSKLTLQQRRDLELLYTEFLDSLTTGEVTQAAVDDWCASVKLWYIVAIQVGKHTAAMQTQAALAEHLCRAASGDAFLLTQEELDSIRGAVCIMRTLATKTTRELATAAAEQAEWQTNSFLKELNYRN